MVVKVESQVVLHVLVNDVDAMGRYCGVGPKLSPGSQSVSVEITFTNDYVGGPGQDRNLLIGFVEVLEVGHSVLAKTLKPFPTGSGGPVHALPGTWMIWSRGSIRGKITLGRFASVMCIEMWGTPLEGIWPFVEISSTDLQGRTGKYSHFANSIQWNNPRFVCFSVKRFARSSRAIQVRFPNDRVSETEDRNVFVRNIVILNRPLGSHSQLPNLRCSWSLFYDDAGPRVSPYSFSEETRSIYTIQELEGSQVPDPTLSAIFRADSIDNFSQALQQSPGSYNLSYDYTDGHRYDAAEIVGFSPEDKRIYFRRRKFCDYWEECFFFGDEWWYYDTDARSFVKFGFFSVGFGYRYDAFVLGPGADIYIVWGKDSTFKDSTSYFRVERYSRGKFETITRYSGNLIGIAVDDSGSLGLISSSGELFFVPSGSVHAGLELSSFEVHTGALPEELDLTRAKVSVFDSGNSLALTILLTEGVQVWVFAVDSGEWTKLGRSTYISPPQGQGPSIPGGRMDWIIAPTLYVPEQTTLYAIFTISVGFYRGKGYYYASETHVLGFNYTAVDGDWVDLDFYSTLRSQLQNESVFSADGLSLIAENSNLYVRHPDGGDNLFIWRCPS